MAGNKAGGTLSTIRADLARMQAKKRASEENLHAVSQTEMLPPSGLVGNLVQDIIHDDEAMQSSLDLGGSGALSGSSNLNMSGSLGNLSNSVGSLSKLSGSADGLDLGTIENLDDVVETTLAGQLEDSMGISLATSQGNFMSDSQVHSAFFEDSQTQARKDKNGF